VAAATMGDLLEDAIGDGDWRTLGFQVVFCPFAFPLGRGRLILSLRGTGMVGPLRRRAKLFRELTARFRSLARSA